MDREQTPWELISIYFRDNPHFITSHHLESYNEFYNEGLPQMLRETNPIHFFKEREEVTVDVATKHVGYELAGRSVPLTLKEMKARFAHRTAEWIQRKWDEGGAGPVKTLGMDEYKYQAKIYLGGRDGDRLYYGKPIIYREGGESRFMYPNEARLKNMTYAFTIHYDVEVVFTLYVERSDGSEKHIIEEHVHTLQRLFLGRFPIMLQSDLCILNGLAPSVRFEMGECRQDPGGYFIIDGKGKGYYFTREIC